MPDAFDRWWAWARKPVDSYETILAEIHNPIMGLSEAERQDRKRVNDAVQR
jgi:hypothetical protein